MAGPIDTSTRRGWRPFWIHQGGEYLLGLVLVATAVQGTTPAVPAIAGGLIVLNAAIVTGPLAAFRAVPRPVHRWLDVGVIAVVALLAALPFLSIDSGSRLTMLLIAGVMAFLWTSTNFESRAETVARRRDTTGGFLDSEALGRVAGRAVNKGAELARRRRERH